MFVKFRPLHHGREFDNVRNTTIFILFNTGLRISEFCGLTISDIDFKKKRIRVDHQLQRAHTMEYIIEDTKTKNGERFVPMSSEVMACFRRIIASRKKPAKGPMVVRGIDLLPDLLLLSDTIYHEEPRKETTFQNEAMPKSRCGSKQIVIYQGES